MTKTTSYQADIRPLFTRSEISERMSKAFNLGSYADDVKKHAGGHLRSHSWRSAALVMPPPPPKRRGSLAQLTLALNCSPVDGGRVPTLVGLNRQGLPSKPWDEELDRRCPFSTVVSNGGEFLHGERKRYVRVLGWGLGALATAIPVVRISAKLPTRRRSSPE